MPEPAVNPLNRNKLLHSKWTAVSPENREKHFIATRCFLDERGRVEAVLLEAALTGRERRLDVRELRNAQRWRMGWR